jgi:hypothetical protein
MVASPNLPPSDVGCLHCPSPPLHHHLTSGLGTVCTLYTVLHAWKWKVQPDEWCAIFNLCNDVIILKGMNVGKHPQCSTNTNSDLVCKILCSYPREVMSCSLLYGYWHFGGICCRNIPAPVCSAYADTRQMEVACSSKTLVTTLTEYLASSHKAAIFDQLEVQVCDII